MEGIIIIAVVFAWISAFMKSAKKKTESAQKYQRVSRPAPAAGRAAKAPKADSPTVQPSGEGMSMAYQPMQTHLSQLLKEETPKHEEYVGSLGVASAEGEDVCDPSLGHSAASAAYQEDAQAVGDEAPLSWSPSAVIQGVVMSVILKRPSERKWGRLN